MCKLIDEVEHVKRGNEIILERWKQKVKLEF